MDNTEGLGAAMEASSNREKAAKAVDAVEALHKRVAVLEEQLLRVVMHLNGKT